VNNPVPKGYNTENPVLQVGEVSDLREQNMIIILEGLGPENHCTGEVQKQL
jgi:hypothetical protein